MRMHASLLLLIACGELDVPELPDADLDAGYDSGEPVDAGPRLCVGTPMGPCAAISPFECPLIPGCGATTDCAGSSRECSSMRTASDCNGQAGCSWSTFGNSCSGSARRCSSLSGRHGCTSQAGCFFDEDCDGVPITCESIPSAALCAAIEGCSWPARDE